MNYYILVMHFIYISNVNTINKYKTHCIWLAPLSIAKLLLYSCTRPIAFACPVVNSKTLLTPVQDPLHSLAPSSIALLLTPVQDPLHSTCPVSIAL